MGVSRATLARLSPFLLTQLFIARTLSNSQLWIWEHEQYLAEVKFGGRLDAGQTRRTAKRCWARARARPPSTHHPRTTEGHSMTESSSSSIPPSSAPASPSATSAATDRTSFEDVAFPASHPAAAAASSPPESTSPLPGRSPTLPSSPSFSSIPFESIAISSSPPKHVVNGTSGGSEGPLEDQRRDKRRSWAKHESKRSSLSALGAVLARESSRSPSYANGSVRNGSLELANGGASTSNGPLTATTPSALSRAVPLPVSPSLPSVSRLSAEPGGSSTNGRTPTSGVNLSVSKVARPLAGAGSHHAPTSGPSKLQEVLSKTRPQHLPPKPRVEDTGECLPPSRLAL